MCINLNGCATHYTQSTCLQCSTPTRVDKLTCIDLQYHRNPFAHPFIPNDTSSICSQVLSNKPLQNASNPSTPHVTGIHTPLTPHSHFSSSSSPVHPPSLPLLCSPPFQTLLTLHMKQTDPGTTPMHLPSSPTLVHS